MNYLLDTCTFLWYIQGSKELPSVVKEVIKSPENDIYLSVASFWEILVKEKINKFKFPTKAARYIPLQRSKHFIESLTLEEEAITYLSKLPDIHKDPFDRILVCQSLHHNMPLLTPDSMLQGYPIKTVWDA